MIHPPSPDPLGSHAPRVAGQTVRIVATLVLLLVIGLWMRHHLLIHGWEGIDGWSLWIGRWEWAHGQPLRDDPTRWNGLPGSPAWINVEWGWQAVLAAVGATPALWILFTGSLVALTVTAWWAWWPLTASRGTPWGALVGASGILWASEAHLWTFRPMLWSLSGWAMLIGVTVRMHRDPRWAWGIVPITIVWANLHGDFLLVFAWLAFEAGWAAAGHWIPSLLDAPRPPRFGRTLGAVAVSSGLGVWLCTPNHAQTITYSLWLSGQSWLSQYIREWSPLTIDPWPLALLGAGIAAAVILRTLQAPWRRDQGPWFFWTIIIFAVSLAHQRYLLYIGVPLGGWWWSGFPTIASGRRAPVPRWGYALLAAWALSVGGIGHPTWRAYTTVARRFAAAAAWIEAHPRPGLLLVSPDAGLLEQAGVEDLAVDGRDGLFLRTDPTRLWLTVAWLFPDETAADHWLARHQAIPAPASGGWTRAAQATAVLHGLTRIGVTRWIVTVPPWPAQLRALRQAHWTAREIPGHLVLYQAPRA